MQTEQALWDAIDELRQSRQDHAVKHAQLDGRIDGVSTALVSLKGSVDDSRRERTAQFETVIERLDDISSQQAERRGAEKFAVWVVGTLIGLGIPAGLFTWYTHGGGK